MARIVMGITADTDAVYDAISEMREAFELLAKCHGQAYRDLEARMERFVDDVDVNLRDLSFSMVDGCIIVGAPPAMADMLREARRLGVIS